MQGFFISLITKAKTVIKKGLTDLSLGCYRSPQMFRTPQINMQINLKNVKKDLEKYMVNIFVEIQKDINGMAESLRDICNNLDDLIKKIEQNIDD